MGIKTSPAALPYLTDRTGSINRNLPFPDDACHAPAIEYCSLFHAVERAKDSFTMLELGAGWGPWMSHAAKACIMRGGISFINVIGIEGDENKIPLIKEHLTINGIRQDSDEYRQTLNGIFSEIIHGVVDVKDGFVDFPLVDVEQYGATVSNTTFVGLHKKISLQSYSLETLMKDFDVFDFIHFDIQGHEFDVIKASIEVLSQKVRYMFVGTHSRKIDGDIISFMFEHDWELLRETPTVFNKGRRTKHLADYTVVDGAQFWKNTKEP
jgi:hypothetical protein